MPKFKLNAKAVEQKSGFEPYDGPEPTRRGMYRGIIKVMKWGLNKNSGSSGFAITLELEAAKGDPKGHAQFDGFPMFSRNIITESANGAALKEGAQRNLSNLLAALGVKDDPEVILEDGDEDKVNVKKIGGKNPIGAVVNIDIDFELYEGERRPSVGGLYPYKAIDADGASDRAGVLDDLDEDEDADLMESEEDAEEADADEAEEGDDEFAARQEELEGLGIPALKKIAKELSIGISGTKAALIERILDAEFAEDEDADAEEAEDEDEDETEEAEEVEEDESEDEDEAEDDEEEEDEEDEEEDEDAAARAARVDELADLDRLALKRILKEVNKDFTVLKKTTDDELREAILFAEFGSELPF